MHDLQKIAKECISEMKAAGIPVQDDRIEKYKTSSLDDCMGLCEGRWENEDYLFTIIIKKELLDDAVDIQDIKEVIVHELIHTCPKCLSHSKTWRQYAMIMNKKIWLFFNGRKR